MQGKGNTWYLGAITGAARGVTGQTGSRAGVHARHTGPWYEEGCGVEIQRCIPGLGREALAAIGVPALSTGVADTPGAVTGVTTSGAGKTLPQGGGTEVTRRAVGNTPGIIQTTELHGYG